MGAVGGSKRNIPVRVNLAAWYRFNNGITNQSGASVWADSSGNSRPLLQATAALRPRIFSSGAIITDGTNDYMQAAFTLIQPFTVYMLFRQSTWVSGGFVFDGATGTTKVTQASSSPQLTMDGGSALTANAAAVIGSAGVSSVMACVFNGANSVFQVAGGGPSVTVTGDAGAGNPGGITIGASRSPGNYGNIVYREIAIYSQAHDATTRLRILRYLGSGLGARCGGIS